MVKKKDSCKCSCGMKMRSYCNCDIGFIKLASIAFILFLITVWPAAMDFVQRVHWGWFLGAMILFCIKPLMQYKKNCCK